MAFGAPEEGTSGRDIALLLIAAAGLAACITIVFLGMRAVMDIGGACAEGGPFVPVQPCPDGAPLLMTLSIFGLIGFGGLGFYAGAKVGGPWVSLPLLGWPALFLSLGWNFLEYGFWPEGGGWVWGWIIPGVLFVIMGAVPLWFAWTARHEATPGGSGVAVASTMGFRTSEGRALRVSYAPRPSVAGPAPAHSGATGGDRDLVARLERLAHLRRTGDLTNAEFETAKQALLAEAHRDPAGESGGTGA